MTDESLRVSGWMRLDGKSLLRDTMGVIGKHPGPRERALIFEFSSALHFKRKGRCSD